MADDSVEVVLQFVATAATIGRSAITWGEGSDGCVAGGIHVRLQAETRQRKLDSIVQLAARIVMEHEPGGNQIVSIKRQVEGWASSYLLR